jgi:hypothetical protein
MMILAIDPGKDLHGWVIYSTSNRHISGYGHSDITEIVEKVFPKMREHLSHCVIEAFLPRGQPLGYDMLETILNVGRLEAYWRAKYTLASLVPRKDVLLHMCDDHRATKAQLNVMVYDRFGGSRSAAYGSKEKPGPLYGIKGQHIRDALALAITYAETWEARIDGAQGASEQSLRDEAQATHGSV